jgi:methyltransferase (TIGR00027 family)
MARRIETQTSRTAQWICVCRGSSYRERSPYLRSGDYVAAALPPFVLRAASHIGLVRRLIRTRFARKGMYEYVVARTRYVDEAFGRAAAEVEQVLIMGAGYDSRAIRFHDQLRHARLFELDAPAPQANKIRGLELRHFEVPPNLVFVPVDFERDSPAQRLDESGFVRGRPCLFLLEGLTMYLTPESIEQTFRLIGDLAGPGSWLVFDYVYASVLRGENDLYGEEGCADWVAGVGESWRFGIERGGLTPFLARYGFKVADEATAATLEARYFTDPAGRVVDRVNGTHALVTARRTG